MKKLIAIILLMILSISAFALRIESGDTSAKGTFYAVLSSDYITPSTGLSDANFTRWYCIDGTYGSAAYVTIAEVNAVNMPGIYEVTFADPNIITLTDCNEAELTLRFYPDDGVTAVSILAAEVFREYRLSVLQADVNALNTVVARELVIYDSPTRADATADKAEIVGWLDEANDVDGTLGLIKIQTDKISDVNNNIRSDIADSNLAITARIEDVNLAAADKTGYKLAADGLDALDVNEPANTDPNTWSFRHAALWPFWLGTNIYKMEIPDLNYPGIGTLTLYKRDGVTPFAVQDINETNNVQIRHSIWE